MFPLYSLYYILNLDTRTKNSLSKEPIWYLWQLFSKFSGLIWTVFLQCLICYLRFRHFVANRNTSTHSNFAQVEVVQCNAFYSWVL